MEKSDHITPFKALRNKLQFYDIEIIRVLSLRLALRAISSIESEEVKWVKNGQRTLNFLRVAQLLHAGCFDYSSMQKLRLVEAFDALNVNQIYEDLGHCDFSALLKGIKCTVSAMSSDSKTEVVEAVCQSREHFGQAIAVDPYVDSYKYPEKDMAYDEASWAMFNSILLDIGELESGLPVDKLCDTPIWPGKKFFGYEARRWENMIDSINQSGSEMAFWGDWLRSLISETIYDPEITSFVASTPKATWDQGAKTVANVIHDKLVRIKIGDHVDETAKLLASISERSGLIGHNHPPKEFRLAQWQQISYEIEQELSHINVYIGDQKPSKNDILESSNKLTKIADRVSSILSEVANDYAKDGIKVAVGVSVAYLVSIWPEVNSKLVELVKLLNQWVSLSG